MGVIPLTAVDLGIAAGLVLLLALISLRLRLGLERRLFISALRTTVQLLLIGLVLKSLFGYSNFGFIFVISMVMLTMAGREVAARQRRRIRGWRGYAIGTGAMFISSFSVTFLALTVIIGNRPWYAPQYAVPLLGMLLGNTMNGIALAMNRMIETVRQSKRVIEQRLLLGHTFAEAVGDIRRESMRSGMIPIINAMAAAGIVSLPGMMTGQILGGSPPMEAVKYQILIMFLICAGTGFGVVAALLLLTGRLTDHRQRLRLDEVDSGGQG